MKKRNILLLIMTVLIMIIMLFFLFLFFSKLTGMSVLDILLKPLNLANSLGRVFINVVFLINIGSPQNTTYNFPSGNYLLSLNVSSNRNVTNWTYTLQDLRHNTTINSSVGFTPNTTISAVRWNNRVTVFATDNAGNTKNNSVVFFINVSNSAPVIGNMSGSIYTCEGSSLSYLLNVSDIDEDVPSSSINPTYPNSPFYIGLFSILNLTNFTYEIYSGTLSKSDAGGVNNRFKTYNENVSVSDGQYSDSRNTNITVIEINNAPSITNIGVKTVWTRGDNTTFYYQVQVTDIEDGNQDSGTLGFNISFSGANLFNISSNGTMNFTPNSSQIGVYNITVCVIDNNLTNPHENISLCGQTGANRSSCNLFSLTVTNENRAPRILSYSPVNLTPAFYEGEQINFNLTNYDPDGTVPDSYWYIDDVFDFYDYGDSSFSYFNHTFNCTSSGNHTVIGKITDGVISSYDYKQWNISVLNKAVCCGDNICSSNESCSSCSADCGSCSAGSVSTGGGGGGGGAGCKEKWGCSDFGNCLSYNKISSFISDYELISGIKNNCSENKWNESFCGFQTRQCNDVNKCGTAKDKPRISRECYYTEFPNCDDGIKNCHNGSCEVLVDCGGPCEACPTCSDGIKNQEEDEIDCGGPCKACLFEMPFKVQKTLAYTLLSFSVISVIISIALIVLYHFKRSEFNKVRKKYIES